MANTGWNLLLYANTDQDVTATAIRDAIASMRSVALPSNCHIAVQLNTKVAMERHWISNGQYSKDPPRNPVDTSKGAQLTVFIDKATEKLGQHPTMLVLCAHGSGLDEVRDFEQLVAHGDLLSARPPLYHIFGSTDRWGPDPTTGDFLTNPEIREAIARSTIHRVELLAFNSCWMGMLEIAFEMREVAATFVSCQVYSIVWPYGDIVARLAADTTQSPEQWAAAFVDAVGLGISLRQRDDAVSAFRTGDSLTALAAAVDAYAERAIVLITTRWPALSDAINNAPRGTNDPHAADLALLVAAATSGDAEAEQRMRAVHDALAAARIDQVTDTSHPGIEGLNIFCPVEFHVNVDEAYEDMAFRTNRWVEFLKKFRARNAQTQGHPHHLGVIHGHVP